MGPKPGEAPGMACSACYYLVISSTHLSNGHFRRVKGVFRGPLCPTATSDSPVGEQAEFLKCVERDGMLVKESISATFSTFSCDSFIIRVGKTVETSSQVYESVSVSVKCLQDIRIETYWHI